jgi:hypothetical protein
MAAFLFCAWIAYGLGIDDIYKPNFYFSSANALLGLIIT